MRSGGFTLLEMIVVLVILGLATALVAPAFLRGIDAWQRQAAIDDLLNQIRGLPGKARAKGAAILIDSHALSAQEPPLVIRVGWTLSVEVPWRVAANGVCEGGDVLVRNEYGTQVVSVAAPFCAPELRP